nr:MAG TPA: portal protein [Bacteriophage sp.]
MGVRIQALKALVTGRAQGRGYDMHGITQRTMSKPPDRNTAEWMQAYITNPRLAPVRKIATDLASVPGKLYQDTAEGREEIADHPFLTFWQRPNPLPEMTPSALWQLLQVL